MRSHRRIRLLRERTRKALLEPRNQERNRRKTTLTKTNLRKAQRMRRRKRAATMRRRRAATRRRRAAIRARRERKKARRMRRKKAARKRMKAKAKKEERNNQNITSIPHFYSPLITL
ncbi:unnamed protein product [Meloidogyne enterolobii]|uniref:Uncharacterized protein n=1 Tax=Meloidogyne enterolobii TaxID=390850 RepID=A0ACB1AB35_MELEN